MDYSSEKIAAVEKDLPSMEHLLGKGLLQPYNNTNSGPRKIMHSVHRDHVLPLFEGEKAIIETGYEIRFGDLSSSVTSTDADYRVVKKISKYSFSPNHHYFLIVADERNKKLDILERVSYHHITEAYGYLYNNQYLDSLMEHDIIPKDTIVQKSLAFDEYNNRKDGVNFNVVYMSLDKNLEDSIVMSESAARRLKAPLLKTTSVMINENNVPINLYGNDKVYKCHPDIGEEIKDGILIELRKEKKEEMPFTESVDNLRRKFMSDEKKRLKGRVIDINIYCNNPDRLNTYHNAQFKMYYDELQRFSKDVVATVTRYLADGYQLSYDLSKLYARSKQVLNKYQYLGKNPFSNIMIDFVIMEESYMAEGDKGSNRFGGKGVVSYILPDSEMPEFGPNHEKVDIIFNLFTMNNRKNPGQVFEHHTNHISHEICNHIRNGDYSVDEAFSMISTFLKVVSPQQYTVMQNTLQNMTMDEKAFFLESIVKSGNIAISTRPISDSLTIDQLLEMYQLFPFVDQYDLYVVMKDSNGKPRRIPARRKAIVAKEYFFRLKQIAEEKFSATSLSATNLRGENTKSKANKNRLIMYPNTPIRFGNMEINSMAHLGIEPIVETLMIHSVSPEARKLVAKMYTENPYHVDIRLDKGSKNVVAEVVMTYLKAIGKRLRFVKVPKLRVNPIDVYPIEFYRDPDKYPLYTVSDEQKADPNFDISEAIQLNNQIENGDTDKCPVVWLGGDVEVNRKRRKENELAAKTRKMNPRERYNFLKKHGYMK